MKSQERSASFCILLSCLLEAFLPVVASSASRAFPPMLFIGLSSAIVVLTLGAYLFCIGELRSLPARRNLVLCFLVAVLIIVIPFTLIFFGARRTTAVNTTILLQMEVLTTFVVYALLFKERHTFVQSIGAVLLLLGAVVILFQGSFAINRGDLLILLAICILPFGNFFAKRVIQELPASHVVFYRYAFASGILLPLSFFWEDLPALPAIGFRSVLLLIAFALCVDLFSKILWYKGLRSMSVSQSVALLPSRPAFSLFFAYLFLHEIPSAFQWVGFACTMLGLWALVPRKKALSL